MASTTTQDWSANDLLNNQNHIHNHQQEQIHPLDCNNPNDKRLSLLPALPVGSSANQKMDDSNVNAIESTVEGLGISTPSSSKPYPIDTSKPPIHAVSTAHGLPPTAKPRQFSTSSGSSPTEQQQQQLQLQQNQGHAHIPPAGPPNKFTRNATAPSLLQTTQLNDLRTSRSNSSTSTFTMASSAAYTCESPMSTLSVHQQQQWLPNGASPKHGPLLTAANSPSLSPYSPSLGPYSTPGGRMMASSSSNSLPLPGLGSRKGSVASLNGARTSPGFRGAPLGQTSDTESVLKQFDVYFGKVYLRGQLQKKADLGLDGHKLVGQQWAAYHAELVGPKLKLMPMAGPGGLGGVAEEMNMEEATVEMQDGPNGGTFTVNWMGANRAVFQPVQQLSLGPPEVGSNCQDWVCAIRLSCYECSRLQEIYTSTLLRRPKFRDQVAATIEGSIKAEGMLKVKFWAGDQWLKLWVVVSDQRGEEVKKKKQGRILQASPIRGQIHFYENQKSKRPLISMYNVSQAYAVCPSRSSINASKDNKADEEGSLTIKLEGDVVMQRENLSPARKGFFSSPTPPSMVAHDLQDLLPAGRSHFAMFQVPNAVERTKFLLGTSEAFRIYGKPGPLLFDSPTDPAAMNFGCMASSLLQQELLTALDAVLHLPQKGESLADVKFSFGEVLRKRLIAENPPPISPYGRARGFSNASSCRTSTMPLYGNNASYYDAHGGGGAMTMPPSPMMAMAMRSRANSTSGFLVPQPSPGLAPTHMSPWAGGPNSPQLSAYSGSPHQGPLQTSSPYNQQMFQQQPQHHRQNYAASIASTDENDANLVTDDEGEEDDDEYPDTPEEEDDGNNSLATPFRSRAGSLRAPSNGTGLPSRKGSVGGLSIHGNQGQGLGGGRTGRSGSFTSAYGVQAMSPSGHLTPQQQQQLLLHQQQQQQKVLELPSLHSFSDDFGLKGETKPEKQGKKLTAVVYPTQVVIPKAKKRDLNSPASATSLHSPLPLPLPTVGQQNVIGQGVTCSSPTIQVNNEQCV
ncbi:hypothetical protein BGZ94_002830 [Podila epigama]|nr:hypothetical protein BGZ94_002830 [Podila epigama]